MGGGAEFNDVLHLSGHGEPVAADLARLLQERSWSRLLLCGHEQQGAAPRLLDIFAAEHAEQVCTAARYVDLMLLGDHAFESSLSCKAGNQVRRNHREFQERFGEVTVRRAADPQEALRVRHQAPTLSGDTPEPPGSARRASAAL